MDPPLYQDLLNQVAETRRLEGRQMQPPCNAPDLATLRGRAKAELHHEIPSEYETFLGFADGLEWNGLVIYGSHTAPIVGNARYSIEGFVEANLRWREVEGNSRFLFFGESGVDLYLYTSSESSYQIRDRQSVSLLETFPSFEHLLVEAFNAHLPED